MNNNPLVSILMPAFNAQGYISKSIQSIVDQTYPNWELLICDDGSSDNTYQVIKRFLGDPRIYAFQNAANIKLLQTRNKLLALAKGELLTFQDADDFCDTNRITRMVEEFQLNPRLGLLSSQIGYVDRNGRALRVSQRPTNYETVLKKIYQENVLGGSYMMMKRNALESVGGNFRSYFDGLSYQDYDLSFLIAEKYEAYCLPDILYYYRQHAASTSKTIDADRLLAKKVVIHLAKQRANRGSDDLQDGFPERVDQYFQELREPFTADPSLVFREYAAEFVYNRLYRKAVYASLAAVRKDPSTWVNWGTLQYCSRKALLKAMGCNVA
jgi:glycosyltransferase involved in cell wall biosynthesis